MKIAIATPALLFPAISLLLLAYTSRFLALSNLIRSLHASYKQQPDELVKGQINNLRRRIYIIRNMQILGVSSFFCCVVAMLFIFIGKDLYGSIVFAFSLLFLLASLALSIAEIQISVNALNLHLSDMDSNK